MMRSRTSRFNGPATPAAERERCAVGEKRVAKAVKRTRRRHSLRPSLRPLVGVGVYGVRADMLRRLVPEGRTHRLSPLVGAMLQYAAACALEKFGRRPPADSVAKALLSASEGDDAPAAVLSEAVEQLSLDAKVESL